MSIYGGSEKAKEFGVLRLCKPEDVTRRHYTTLTAYDSDIDRVKL